MTGLIIIFLLLLCIGCFLYIFNIRKQEKEWLIVLQDVQQGRQEKIFTKGTGIMADISYELNDIIETNKMRIAHLEKVDEAKKQILTSLSHDVRTPLASLLGYLEALENGIPDKTEQKEYISVAYRKANDLKSYVDMLFEWFKLNSREQQFHFDTEDINELTREIIIEWLPVLEKEKIEISAQIADDELLLPTDRMAYKRMINNLIQNAIRHGNCTRISVIVEKRMEHVQVSVINDGSPIPPDQLPYIFDRLYKGDHARSQKGSGLGLAITKELASALQGEITVTSSQVPGTRFQITLPFTLKVIKK